MAIGLRILRLTSAVLGLLIAAGARLASADAHLFADLYPGPNGSGPGPFVHVGTGAFFRAATADGYELWRTDGTLAGTAEVLDIRPGAQSSDPRSLTPAGGRLFFVATDATQGPQVWVSDGTAAGTLRLSSLTPPSSVDDPTDLTPAGGLVYFVGRDAALGAQLWATDGTPAGTSALASFGSIVPSSLVDFGGTLYFVAGDPSAPDGDREIWRSDGTPGGTERAVDVLPGPQGSRPSGLTVSNGALHFFAHAASGEPELWRSLGTPATTERLATFPLVTKQVCTYGHPPTCKTVVLEPYGLTTAGSHVLFGVYHPGEIRLWTTDGSTAGTTSLASIVPLTYEVPPFYYYEDEAVLVAVGSTVFFRGTGTELWKSDGTANGTGPVGTSSVSVPSRVIQLKPVGGLLFFTGRDDIHGPELWRTDGTAPGTVRLTNGPDTTDDTIVDELTDVDGTLYFALHDPTQPTVFDSFGGYEPWKSDGTPGGTVQVAEIVPGPIGSSPRDFTRVNGTLLFAATKPCVAQGWEPFTEGPATPPPGTCGDGVQDGGEQCDLGDANGADDTCCRCDCTFRGFDNRYCRMPAGGCDSGAFCTGDTATCPAPVPQDHCGDGVLDPGEQCDPASPAGGTCCTSCCQFLLPGLICRPSTASCDPVEKCTGTSGTCPPDQQSCEASDVCTNSTPGSLFGARLRLRTVAQGPSVLTLDGKLQLPASPPIDPVTKGLRVLVSGADGATLADVQAAAGPGWQARTGGGWSYTNRAAGPGQIEKARLMGTPGTGQLSLHVRARAVPTAVSAGSVPPVAAVLVDATAANSAQCGKASLATCVVRSTRLGCR